MGAKPVPDRVLEACAWLGVGPEHSGLVGDSRFDAEPARAAGSRLPGIGGIEGDATLASLLDVLR